MKSASFLTYGGERLPYKINVDPGRQTRIAIHVEPDGEIVVDVPEDASLSDVQRAVHKRARWVFSQVGKARERFRHVRPKEYVSGEEILYLGRRYVLKVVQDDKAQPVKLKGRQLLVHSRSLDPDIVRGKVWAWYRVKGRDYFDKKLDELARRLPWVEKRPPFRLQEMEKRWGSCTANGEIILNPHLIKAPRDCIEYVLLHELAHLRHHDHGPEFWKLIEVSAPQWRVAKVALDDSVETIAQR